MKQLQFLFYIMMKMTFGVSDRFFSSIGGYSWGNSAVSIHPTEMVLSRSNIIYDSAFYFYFLQWGHLALHTFAINQDIEIDWIIEIQCNFKRHNKLSFYILNIQVSKLLSRLVEKALLLLGQQSSSDSRVLSINSVSSVIIGPLENKMKKE